MADRGRDLGLGGGAECAQRALHGLLQVELGGQAVDQALSENADTVDVTRAMRTTQALAAITEHQPRITEAVFCHVSFPYHFLR